MKVGGTASITATTQIVSMVFIGFLAGQWMDWSKMDSIFLGVILSISSTTIILKTFDELGVKAQKFAGIVIGSLIVQDILAILMMVLLSTIAVSEQFSGGALLQSIFKLIFFLTLWFVSGIFFIPTLLKKAKHLLTDEMLLITINVDGECGADDDLASLYVKPSPQTLSEQKSEPPALALNTSIEKPISETKISAEKKPSPNKQKPKKYKKKKKNPYLPDDFQPE